MSSLLHSLLSLLLLWSCLVCFGRRAVAEWGIYFHMHAAESYTAEGNPIKAQECAEAGAELAREQGMLEQQVSPTLWRLLS